MSSTDHVDVEALWSESGGGDLLKGKSYQDLFDSLENTGAFELKDRNLRCIDEGTPGGVHLAGSGVLYQGALTDLDGRVEGVYSHQGCGAAAMYCKDRSIDGDSDEVGDKKAAELAEMLGVPYRGRIGATEMTRPAAIHIARAVYYDGSGKFDPAQVRGLPQGFVVSRGLISDINYAKKEVEVAIAIARGAHGFGDKFTEESPLYLVAVCKKGEGEECDKLLAELKDVALNNPVLEIVSIQG